MKRICFSQSDVFSPIRCKKTKTPDQTTVSGGRRLTDMYLASVIKQRSHFFYFDFLLLLSSHSRFPECVCAAYAIVWCFSNFKIEMQTNLKRLKQATIIFSKQTRYLLYNFLKLVELNLASQK